jgi:hypothetical protein
LANPDHLKMLRQGVNCWNAWRTREPTVRPDLSGANLCELILRGVNLHGVDLRMATLRKTNLRMANLGEADLRGANLRKATLSQTNFDGANLGGADLQAASLRGASLIRAKLPKANLSNVSLVDADLTAADLSGCRIYGMSAWKLILKDTTQKDLVITARDESEVTLDNIEVAQFVYLLLNNAKIRDVIDTITSKTVLILGRFTNERKAILDALRDELRKRDYVPILFDFDNPASRSRDETITLLARMARFVIVDISDAKSVLQELRAVVPELPSVPVQPLIITTQEDPGMFDFYRRLSWFLPVHRYDTPERLLADISNRVIRPAEAKVRELRGPRLE